MKVLTIIVRTLLGLMFVLFGSNAFLKFLPMPEIPPSLAKDFMTVFFASGYLYVIGGFQVLGGLFLLIGKFVPLGLTILGAIIVNILAFHVLMGPKDIVMGLVVALMELFLLWRYREAFRGIFTP